MIVTTKYYQCARALLNARHSSIHLLRQTERLRPVVPLRQFSASLRLCHDDTDTLQDIDNAETLFKVMEEYSFSDLQPQKVLIVQPNFLTGPHVRTNTKVDFMLEESYGLVKTLGWDAVGHLTFNVHHGIKLNFFGSGQMDIIRSTIKKIESGQDLSGENGPQQACHHRHVTALFVSTFRLSPAQISHIQEVVGKPVFDRFHVVLQIFKSHASTKEANLQVQLAEIPYLKQRLDGDHELELLNKHSKSRKGEEWFSKRRMALAKKERHIKQKIQGIVQHRSTLRKRRQKLQIPTVAVVGYTNAGKTSLIKALTGSSRLEPLDQLFATLDVTVHGVQLPSKTNALMVDTVGFISDIPTSLIASFNATLEDALLADVLVHVRDMSNPDHVAQDDNVMETLTRIDVPQALLDNMIVVGNKIDLVRPEDWSAIKADGIVPISCKAGFGMTYLTDLIDKAVIRAQGKRKVVVKIRMGATRELAWLQKWTSVTSVDDDGAGHWHVTTLINKMEFNQFKKAFMNV